MRAESISKGQAQSQSRRLFLLYHEVRSGGSEYSYVTDSSMFDKHLDLCVRLRQSKGIWPELTFDDGHISNLEVAAPMLQSRGLTAKFFITVGWTGKRPCYMGWPELRSLHGSGQLIGAHGWSHTLLTHCNDVELQRELNGSRLTLEDNLGTSITTMSLPGGRCNGRVLTACREAGYTQVYTSVPRVESLPRGGTVGRRNIQGNMRPEWIEKLFQPNSSLLGKLERQHRIKETAKALLGDKLYAKLWALKNRQEQESEDHWEAVE